jgi:hypothetical protein
MHLKENRYQKFFPELLVSFEQQINSLMMFSFSLQPILYSPSFKN